jgi:hypothetical protein
MQPRFILRCAFALVLGLAAQPVHAHPQAPGPTLDVANPSAGSMLTPGVMIIEGVAYDDSADDGVGVDRVSLFLGDREEGGVFLGNATLGLHNPQAVEGGDPQFADAGWRLRTPVLKGGGQQRDLTVYARSSVSGVETTVSIPVIMGEETSTGAGGRGGGDESGPDD